MSASAWPTAAFPRSHSALLRAWRGEIGLYRAAYGLGGLGLAVASLAGDGVLDTVAALGSTPGWFVWSAVSAAELLVAWIAAVATWRSVSRGIQGNVRYGFAAIGFALPFVGAQLVLTITWIGWTALAGLELVASPVAVLFDGLILLMG